MVSKRIFNGTQKRLLSFLALHVRQTILTTNRTKILYWQLCRIQQRPASPNSSCFCQYRNSPTRLLVQSFWSLSPSTLPVVLVYIRHIPFYRQLLTLQVRCDDPKNNCRRGVTAYTVNPTGNEKPYVNFCSGFFRQYTLDKAVNAFKDEKNPEIKWNVDNYMNRGKPHLCSW